MTLTLVPPSRVPHEWDAISAVLGPLFKSTNKDILEMFEGMMGGEYAVLRVSGPAQGYVVARAAYPIGVNFLVLWVVFVAGHVDGGPKARMSFMRAVLDDLERIAARHNCKQVRFEGREAFRHIAPDYHEVSRQGREITFAKVI